MAKKVAITGMGIISSIGNSVEENYNALISGSIGISTIENIETIHKDVIKVGEIKKNTTLRCVAVTEINDFNANR